MIEDLIYSGDSEINSIEIKFSIRPIKVERVTVTIELMDLMCRMVKKITKHDLLIGTYKQSVNLTDIKSGLYFIQVVVMDRIVDTKFIKITNQELTAELV